MFVFVRERDREKGNEWPLIKRYSKSNGTKDGSH